MQIKKLPPITICACGSEYRGIVCPICKAENPTFTAIKNIAKKDEEKGSLVSLAGEVC